MTISRLLRVELPNHAAMRDGTPEKTAIAELESVVPRSRWTSEPAFRWRLDVLPGGKRRALFSSRKFGPSKSQ